MALAQRGKIPDSVSSAPHSLVNFECCFLEYPFVSRRCRDEMRLKHGRAILSYHLPPFIPSARIIVRAFFWLNINRHTSIPTVISCAATCHVARVGAANKAILNASAPLPWDLLIPGPRRTASRGTARAATAVVLSRSGPTQAARSSASLISGAGIRFRRRPGG